MKFEYGILAIILFSVIISLPSTTAQGNSLEAISDIQSIDVGDVVYGGHLTFVLDGAWTQEFRAQVYENWDINDDSYLNNGEVCTFIKQGIEKLLEDTSHEYGILGSLRITRADPLHDDDSGILKVASDAAGLIGNINSDSTITIKLLLRGDVINDDTLSFTNEKLIYSVVRAACTNSTSFNQTGYNELIGMVDEIKVHHTQVFAGIGGYSSPNIAEGSFYSIRFIVGQFFTYDSTEITDDTFVRDSFNILESPILLFIIYLVFMTIGRYAETANFNKHEAYVGPQKRKRLKLSLFGIRMLLLVLYFIPTLFFIFYLSGLYYIIFCAIYVVLAYVISEMIYRPRTDVSEMEEEQPYVEDEEESIEEEEYVPQEEVPEEDVSEVEETPSPKEVYEEDDVKEVDEEEELDDASEFLSDEDDDYEDDEDFE